jgi:hypothetical protein
MISDDRKKDLRFKAWAMARCAIMDAANGYLPGVDDEEDEYLRSFMYGIAERTAPGEYREKEEGEEALAEALASMRAQDKLK